MAAEEEVLTFDPSLKKKKKSSKSKPKLSEDTPETESHEESIQSSIKKDVDETTDLMADLSTKKKKKSKPSFAASADDSRPSTGDAADGSAEAEGGDDVAAFDAKKKKKKKKTANAAADFDALLQESGISGEKASKSEKTATSASPVAVNELGEADFTYPELLSRFFKVLADNNPDLASDRTGQKYKIPPPEVKRDGKKTLFVNIKEISDRLHRPNDHIISFLYAELGTTGSIDGSHRLVIKGRFQQKQIETVLRKYIVEYVTCKTCKSINTVLKKENRLFFLDCNSCGSRRSVSSIKTGFQAVIRRQKPTS